MRNAFGLELPQDLVEICAPERCALIVYDMQNGIVSQIGDGKRIVAACKELLEIARKAGMRVFFTRHLFLPTRSSGAGQLRRAMIWQRKDNPSELSPMIAQSSEGWQIVPELAPGDDEVIVDKITMSAFEGTFLNLAMRDAHLDSFVIAGIALEVGIEPTVRHGVDLNFIPVIVADACGSKTPEAYERSLLALKETGEVVACSTEEVAACFTQGGKGKTE